MKRAVENVLGMLSRIRARPGSGTLAILLGLVSVGAPLLLGKESIPLIGVLLVVTGSLQVFYSFRRVGAPEQRSESWRGKFTLLAGLLIYAAPAMASAAAIFVIALLLGAHAVQAIRFAIRDRREGRASRAKLIEPFVSLGLAVTLLLAQDLSARLAIGFGAAYWQFSAGWALWTTPTRGLLAASEANLFLPDVPELRALARTLARDEARRRRVDRSWVVTFLLILFAVHAGRMQTDWDLVGAISPGVALLGDSIMALLLAFVMIIPGRLAFLRLSRRFDPRLWEWASSHADSPPLWALPARLITCFLKRRLLFVIRVRQARYSVLGTLERGLQTGLPLVAIIVATTPIWGVSWYFDTENWAAGVWNSWAEARTSTWREAMVDAVSSEFPERSDFRIRPAGVNHSGDFSFIVIGDTGEGDASQLVLKHQLVLVGNQPEVKFLVLSSDVIYPSGEMKDYEAKFFLPFAGLGKPVYAIPGNHDWYDALEGFAATFFRPEAARLSMRARIEVDREVTTTRDRRIEAYLETARWLRSAYRVQTGYQDAPFFRFETGDFCLLAVDTGVARRVDEAQWQWLETALEESRGKFRMVVLGHPLYAGGVYQAENNEDFASIHDLLRQHQVELIMAGDTHDFEYYREETPSQPIHHFVNGGGGAYLSFGTTLGWPAEPATRSWAVYPGRAAVVDKLDRLTPPWKKPFLYWTKRLQAWPFSPEALSAFFDYNVAPFFQSFTEIRVELSKGRVRVIPYGVHGPLQWRDLDRSGDLSVHPGGSPVEFVIPWGQKAAPGR